MGRSILVNVGVKDTTLKLILRRNSERAAVFGCVPAHEASISLKAPSFNVTQAAFLSVDGGATALAQFNNSGNGDAGDFTTSPCLIQSWQVCSPELDFNGVSYNVGSISYQMLEAVGWNPTAAVPGPVVGAGIPGLLLGFGGLIAWARRVRRSYLTPG